MSEQGQLKRLAKSVSELLFTKKNAGRGAALPLSGAPGDAARAKDGADDPVFAGRLKSLLSKQGTISAGRLQILGFDAIREELGDTWERLRGQVAAFVDTAIRKRLTQTDVYARYGELLYIIVFGELTKEEAEIKSALIAEEIWQTLFGEGLGGNDVAVSSVVVDVDGRVIAKEIDLLGTIGRLLENATAGQSARRAIDEAPRQIPLAAKRRSQQQSQTPDLRFLFRPIWDVKRSAILRYQCFPAQKVSPRHLVEHHESFGLATQLSELFELDCLVLKQTVAALRFLFDKERRLLAGCQVHYESLARSESHRRYIELCHTIPEELRKYLILELTGTPEGVPQICFFEIASTLKPFCVALQIEAMIGQSRFDALDRAGVEAIGVDLQTSRGSEAVLMKMMNAFAENVKRAGFESYIHGIGSTSLATNAVCAGFDHISGEAIQGNFHKLEHAYRFEAQDLFFAAHA